MSQIGNYIHRTFTGYLEGEGRQSWEGAKNSIIDQAISSAGEAQSNLQAMEQMAQSILTPQNDQQTKYSAYVHQKLQEYLDNEFYKSSNSIVKATVNVSNPGDAIVPSNLQELVNSFNILKQDAVASYQKGVVSPAYQASLLQRANVLYNKVISIATQEGKNIPVVDTSSYESLEQALSVLLAYPPIKLIKGAIGEFIAAVSTVAADEYSEDILTEAISQNLQNAVIVGQERVTRTTDFNKIIPGFKMKTSYSSQGKVDVIFEYNNMLERISAKNYSVPRSGAEIHLLSSANLFYLFQNHADFFNHFLNLYVNHLGRTNGIQAKRKQMYTDFKYVAVAIALVGSKDIAIDKANIFMLMARNGNEVKVKYYSVADLVRQLRGTSDISSAVHVKFNKQPFTQSTTNLFTQPLKADSANARINELLKDVHAKTLSLSVIAKALGF